MKQKKGVISDQRVNTAVVCKASSVDVKTTVSMRECAASDDKRPEALENQWQNKYILLHTYQHFKK